MSIIKEFKDFISRGNVIELAVGIVIGAAFAKITASFVSDILMPPLGLVISGINFRNIKIILQEASLSNEGQIISEAVSVNIGNFIQVLIEFLIIAFFVFIVVKLLNRIKKKELQKAPEAAPVNKQEMLLTEIRDLLKKS